MSKKNSKYKVIIVDDEFLARKLLTGYVEKIDELELVATCGDAFEAMACLQKENIDIILLDIHMPEITGLELVRSLKHTPEVIFTTAYSEYAIDSYELGAIDYLLKPIAFPRFFQSVNKAIAKINSRRNFEESVVNDNTDETPTQELSYARDFITIKADYKIYKVNHSDLIFIEGQQEYVTFHTATRRITALYSLKNLEQILPKDQFLRIHKSYIVSFHHIEDIEAGSVTVGGKKIPVGGSYREALMARLNLK